MDNKDIINTIPQFSSPEQEIAYLKMQLAEKQAALESAEPLSMAIPKPPKPEDGQLALEVVKQYATEVYGEELEDAIEEANLIDSETGEKQPDGLTLDLQPDDHDHHMSEFFGILETKGVKAALTAAERLGNAHVLDDFHRFVARYLAEKQILPGVKENTPMHKLIDTTLFEVILPDTEGEQKNYRDFISLMEQFFAGMQSITRDDQKGLDSHFTLEIGISQDQDHVVFYTAVPTDKIQLFEKQILGLYQDAVINPMPNDYNPFADDGQSVGAWASLKKSDVLTITTYDKFDHDPLNVILNVFSKLDTVGEGAAIQITVKPVSDKYVKEFGKVLGFMQKGEKLSEAQKLAKGSLGTLFMRTSSDIFKAVTDKNSDSEQPKEPSDRDQDQQSSIQEKIRSTIVETNIRLIASAQTINRAKDILSDMQAAFNQFTNTSGASIDFTLVPTRKQVKFFEDFAFRRFDNNISTRLNFKELATIFHFPTQSDNSQLKQNRAVTAAPPIDRVQEGITLGINKHRGVETTIKMGLKDRVRHTYVIGQTGTGKSVLLTNMIYQDILNGDGCCFIDPHGSDVQDILSYIPDHRLDDVIYFDPAYTARPMGLNMLEYDQNFPEQKTFVVDEIFGIFKKLFGANPESMGPMFEQYFRNATMLVIEDPDTGSTLLDVSRVLSDEAYRKLKISRCKNPIVVQFWTEIAGKAGGDASLQNIVPYITSKFDIFLANEIMRPIVSQQTSVLNFREIMDNKKILLVNLSKGRLGDINANLIGLILVGKIQMAALSRVDSFGKKELPPFYLYIDEFQNVTTSSISSILSEARKYGLSLNVAHQYISQLQEDIKNAVFGNVGSVAVFRINNDDAKFMEQKFAPTFTAKDIQSIPNWNAVVAMLMNGSPVKPFNIATLPPPQGRKEIVEPLKQLSWNKYGRDRAEVEAEIMEKYK